MTSSTRAEILRLVGELSQRFPDLRFGQMVENICNAVPEPAFASVWDVEDEDFLRALRELLDSVANRSTVDPTQAVPA